MRDPKRISRIIALITQIWENHPNLRLSQLIGNCFPRIYDLYYMEDDKLEKALKETYPNEQTSDQNSS